MLLVWSFSSTVHGEASGPSDKTMVLVPAGEYMMGKDSDKGFDFSPAHKVKVDAFLIDKYEVTNEEYLRFCEETGHALPEFWNTKVFRSGKKFPTYPVVGVKWSDATAYAAWAGKRLPTEAEWEFASRGGLIGEDYSCGGEWTKEKAQQDGRSWKNLIEPIGQYAPNGYGLYDTGGNVWEWVADYYAEDYYKVSPVDNPTGPEKAPFRVLRSGSWHSGSFCKTVHYRKSLPGNWCDFAVGFRCVKDVSLKTRTSDSE
jgi:iron(II)-dependent oxidoreductase